MFTKTHIPSPTHSLTAPSLTHTFSVVCASAGNHAQAMAYHGRDLGIEITCVMPIGAPLNKVNKCRDYGANVLQHGAHIGEAFDHAMSLVERDNSTYINGCVVISMAIN
jgi:threonine dehydratase